MNHLTHDEFKQLATFHQPHSITIYIPTHRAGKENQKIDQLNLKNKIQEVVKELQSWQLVNKDIDQLLRPARDLLDDSSFWSRQSDGLAIFCAPGFFSYYTLPGVFDEMVYVSDHFYIIPLLNYLNHQSNYYLLSLSLSGAQLYEGFAHHLQEVEVKGIFPEKFEDAVGHDFKENNLQFRAGQSASGKTMFHGHGNGKEDEKQEIRKFFRAIDDALMGIIKNRQQPLILAAVDYLVPIYQEITHYQNLHPDFIHGNQQHVSQAELHNRVKIMLNGDLTKSRKQKHDNFEQAISAHRASYSEEEIIPACFNQRVDTLFVKAREVMWGVFDMDNNTVLPRTNMSKYKSCLLNFATVHTILNNGEVFVVEPEDMPESSTRLNAIFRF